ncbi:MAG: hypothetical protein LBD02_10350 [Christensenellaceae bacterium]|nr:hypothetical protein [Christensenellaceae bacterium]
MPKDCVLEDRICTSCGECERCDLNPAKICDNCGICIEPEEDYAKVPIEKVDLGGDTQ